MTHTSTPVHRAAPDVIPGYAADALTLDLIADRAAPALHARIATAAAAIPDPDARLALLRAVLLPLIHAEFAVVAAESAAVTARRSRAAARSRARG